MYTNIKCKGVTGLRDNNWNEGFGTAIGVSPWIFSAFKNVLYSFSPIAYGFNSQGREHSYWLVWTQMLSVLLPKKPSSLPVSLYKYQERIMIGPA